MCLKIWSRGTDVKITKIVPDSVLYGAFRSQSCRVFFRKTRIDVAHKLLTDQLAELGWRLPLRIMSWESRSRPVGPQHDLVKRQLVLLVLLLLSILGVRSALAVHGEESRGEQKQQEHRPPVPRATGHLREREKKEDKKDRRQTSINLVDTRQGMRHANVLACTLHSWNA